MMLLSVCLKCDFLKFRSGTANIVVVQEQQKRFRHYAVRSVAASDSVPVGSTLVRTAAFLFCCATARFHFR